MQHQMQQAIEAEQAHSKNLTTRLQNFQSEKIALQEELERQATEAAQIDARAARQAEQAMQRELQLKKELHEMKLQSMNARAVLE